MTTQGKVKVVFSCFLNANDDFINLETAVHISWSTSTISTDISLKDIINPCFLHITTGSEGKFIYYRTSQQDRGYSMEVLE